MFFSRLTMSDGDDLDGAADGDGDEDEHGEGQVVLDEALVPVGPDFLGWP